MGQTKAVVWHQFKMGRSDEDITSGYLRFLNNNKRQWTLTNAKDGRKTTIPFLNNDLFSNDGVHLNSSGYNVLNEILFEELIFPEIQGCKTALFTKIIALYNII